MIPIDHSSHDYDSGIVQVMELQRPGWRQRATPEPEDLPVTAEECREKRDQNGH